MITNSVEWLSQLTTRPHVAFLLLLACSTCLTPVASFLFDHALSMHCPLATGSRAFRPVGPGCHHAIDWLTPWERPILSDSVTSSSDQTDLKGGKQRDDNVPGQVVSYDHWKGNYSIWQKPLLFCTGCPPKEATRKQIGHMTKLSTL